MNRIRALVGVFVVAALCVTLSSAAAVELLNETFDDDAVGGLPNTGNYIGNDTAGSDLEVAGPGGT